MPSRFTGSSTGSLPSAINSRINSPSTIQPDQPSKPTCTFSTGSPALLTTTGKPAAALRNPCAIAAGHTLDEANRSQPSSTPTSTQNPTIMKNATTIGTVG